ncbi:CbtA family protein [Sciscionella sediminilitoris]|uniref:CbtA family protein n=1 Tax=Sciscionella sediminilitoris TaxID=1445613 RepID=UPI0004DFA92E|nr:CbtA family protein [Sciscionella sp. SE31]
MVGKLLVRGMLAGLVAGALAFVFGKLFGEPSIGNAIGFEEAHASEPEGPELVSRAVQGGLGLAVAVIVFGIAIGGIYALVFALAHGRIGTTTAGASAASLGVLGFCVVYLVPFLKYPANPPAVGEPDTIGQRTGEYFGMMLASVVLAVLAVFTYRALRQRFGGYPAGLLAALGYVVLVAVCAALMPGVDEVPKAFPADTLWNFRVAAIGTQAVLWLVLALVFAPLAKRVLQPAPDRALAAVRQA